MYYVCLDAHFGSPPLFKYPDVLSLQAMIWDYLGLTRVYTKRKGNPPDLAEPVVLSAIRKGTTVKALCQNVSTHMLRDFNFGEDEI